MSYKKQYFEWDITKDELISNTPVGYEVEFSQDPRFYPILSKFSTYEEVVNNLAKGKFYFSLDNGITWSEFPISENGQIFTQPYRMRLVVSATEIGYIYALRNKTVYRITADGKSIIDSYEISEPIAFNQLEIQEKDDILYIPGFNNTLYKLYINDSIEPFSYSLNLNLNPLAIAVDSNRKSFWEINQNNICLKTLNGEKIFCVENPLKPIDVDYSSSSSSSSSVGYSSSSSSLITSSSSSVGYSSSSSSLITSSSSSSLITSSSSSSLITSSSSSVGYSSSSSSRYEGIDFDRVEIDFGVG